MTAEEIRRAFLDFFAEKGHKIVPSAPIVVRNDPTLLFTNAGMNQFKDYFLGNKKAEHTRVADTQKCLRVSGKHNDLEEVGIDTYHHTMFEMLGNWSFGDYFKKEAISWAWELLTERYGMDKSRLYVTIFEGDAKERLEEDTESLQIWSERVQKDHILRGNKKDNFWEMGDTGPCGPCTEIHFDLRPDEERKAVPGAELVNNDHPQVIEIWNNVFIQYNRKADGSLEQLPDKHVDTGMGFERLVRVLQGKHSNYDTDVFRPLIHKMEKDLRFEYGKDEKKDIAARVIADHVRAVTFTIADGQLPSNTGAGYVIRRILRRAVRYGYSFLGMEQPYIYQLVTVLAQQFKNIFPEVIKQEDFIKKVVQEEEASFLRTLASGTKLFEKHVEGVSGNTIEGTFAFELYDTFGFPSDLTQLMARERGLDVDMEGFNAELQKQKTRSRQASVRTEGDWTVVVEGAPVTKFIGYDTLEADVNVIRYREVNEKGKTAYHLVLDQTPFYPEGGGQVGDTGVLTGNGESLKVLNTFKENDLIIHVVDKLPAEPASAFSAQVDEKKRRATVANHTATHLLHAALRQVLGTHVAQKGSLVHPKGLRFDFSHFSKMTEQEIAKVEHMVNERIRQNIPLKEERAVPFDEAKNRGAMALFGEKYGDKVRVITFDPSYSVELCGGTHAQATGQLGFFKIVSESAIAAGVRRIEAITGEEAEAWINEQQTTINEIRETLKNPKDMLKSIEALREQNKKLEQEIEKYKLAEARGMKDELIQKAQPVQDGVSLLVEEVETADMDAGKNLAFELRSSLPKGIVLLGARMGDKAGIWLSIPEEIGQKTGLHAGNIIREIAPLMEGGGGGQAAFASAGGKNPKGVSAALAKGREIVMGKLGV
jgi:alanyl-tRNA synthetase